MSDSETFEKYFGSRGGDFRSLIESLLRRGKLNPKYYDTILGDGGLDLYSTAFTHPTIDEENNYEFYEMMGDATANCCIVWYINRCFPQLHCPGGVKMIARLKINLVSKRQFGDIGINLGLWPFVSATTDVKDTKMKQTLEDVFEAIIGVTQTLIDTRIKQGAGHSICYNMIESIYNEMVQPISLKYEHLFDAKTRLKETFDFPDYKQTLTTLKYSCQKNIEERMNYVTITAVINGRMTTIGNGTGPLKPTAEQHAAANALANLKRYGYDRPVPDAFAKFCK
tara:strand:- start:1367 stop:2212 length:846 start_codon:yes stop_codon:yes gene_type:complete